MAFETTSLRPFRSLFLLGLVAAWGVACSAGGAADGGDGDGDGDSAGDGDGDGDAAGTGAAPGDGDAPATGAVTGDGDGDIATGGGLGDGDGDLPGTGGDMGTGGSSGGAVFTCPAGSDALVVDLNAKTTTDITPIPAGPTAENYFLEGPVWINGALYMSQIRDYGEFPPSAILKYTPGGDLETFISDAGTNGLALNAAGQIVGASHKVGGIVTFDPSNAATPATTVVDSYNGNRLNSPNDLTIRSDGTIYFTDPTWQCGNSCSEQPVKGVYRVAPGSAPELLTVLQNDPNGIALSPDESTLYVGGDVLASYPVNADGSIGAGANFGSGGSDGLAIDCAGNVYATQSGNVVVYSSAGANLGSITTTGNATNAAFGGPNNTTLFVTGMNSASLGSVELNVPGYPY